MANLLNFVHRKVAFKNGVENKSVRFRLSLDSKIYNDALIKMVMNDLVTIVYTEDYEVKERTFTTDECYDYIEFKRYEDKLANIVYTTDLKRGDAIYIQNRKSNALFRSISDNELKTYCVDRDGDIGYCNIDINDVISGKIAAEVWEYE